jgi:hypothetical protein
MSEPRKFDLNPETLLYEISSEPRLRRLARYGLIFMVSLLLAALYFWILFGVLGLDTPKTAWLKSQNEAWSARMAVLNRDMDRQEETLRDLEMRNGNVYRSIFGMTPLTVGVLGADADAVGEYGVLDEIGRNSTLRESYIRLDRLMKRTYLDSKSFDEVAALSKRAGQMASCIPAIPPIDPDPRHYNISSPFGVRTDPVYGDSRMHTGVDFSTKKGTPIYATGDGTVESAQFLFTGYGNVVTIDHGFGYETMYAHMNEVFVVEGMQIKRGQCIGTVGRSGKATGDHLHYEVLYRGTKVNPANFYDLSMSKEEYATMVQKREEESPAMLRSGFRVRTR